MAHFGVLVYPFMYDISKLSAVAIETFDLLKKNCVYERTVHSVEILPLEFYLLSGYDML